MFKKLSLIFGPILMALVLVVILFSMPLNLKVKQEKTLQHAASAMTVNVLTGDYIKNNAMAKKEYIPFFGSSELKRFDAFHPSVMAKKYQRGYTPFLLGAPGTQSLAQLMMMQSMSPYLKHKKAVFIISPQWFIKKGVKSDYFNLYFSQLQTLDWLLKIKRIDDNDRYLADRLLNFIPVQNQGVLTQALNRISHHQMITNRQRRYLTLKHQTFKRADQLFSTLNVVTHQNLINRLSKQLPQNYNYQKLDQLANQIAQKKTDNNQFQISNQFYKQQIKQRLPRLKGMQAQLDYRQSPEYSDFQLVLNQFAKNDMKVLFIIPPVNQKWQKFTGLSEEMLNDFDRKIKYQLQSQGFNQIADFTNQGAQPYFMTDTIHLGWRGWLKSDQYIKRFLTEQTSTKTEYQIKPEFLKEDWQLDTGQWADLGAMTY